MTCHVRRVNEFHVPLVNATCHVLLVNNTGHVNAHLDLFCYTGLGIGTGLELGVLHSIFIQWFYFSLQQTELEVEPGLSGMSL